MPEDLRRVWEIGLLALALWREAQNQVDDVIIVVGCSMRNRVKRPRWWGYDWVSVLLHHDQYSSFNRGDVNATKMPLSTDTVFPRCLAIAALIHDSSEPDAAESADSYFDHSLDKDPPIWATDGSKILVKSAGPFHFYRTLGEEVRA